MTRGNPETTRTRGKDTACRGAAVVAGAILAVALAGCTQGGEPGTRGGETGAALFQRHCSGCHPDGRNLLYPQKDLRRLTLAANGITKPEQIVAVMRNPGRGMTRFGRETIPDPEARRIADYVLEAFR